MRYAGSVLDKLGPYGSGVIFVAVAGVFAALLIGDLERAGQMECSVCIEFDGRESCDAGQGPTRRDALLSAKTVACAPLTSGMGDAFRCRARPPKNVSCSEL